MMSKEVNKYADRLVKPRIASASPPGSRIDVREGVCEYCCSPIEVPLSHVALEDRFFFW